MIFEFVVFMGALIGALIFFAEFGRKMTFGLFGSVFLLFLGLWIVVDGVQIQTGEITQFSGVDNSTTLSAMNGTELQNGTKDQTTNISVINLGTNKSQNENASSSTTFGHTENKTKVYSELQTPYTTPNISIGLPFVLLALGSIFHYLSLSLQSREK